MGSAALLRRGPRRHDRQRARPYNELTSAIRSRATLSRRRQGSSSATTLVWARSSRVVAIRRKSDPRIGRPADARRSRTRQLVRRAERHRLVPSIPAVACQRAAGAGLRVAARPSAVSPRCRARQHAWRARVRHSVARLVGCGDSQTAAGGGVRGSRGALWRRRLPSGVPHDRSCRQSDHSQRAARRRGAPASR